MAPHVPATSGILGKGSVQAPVCWHCCIRGAPALSLNQNPTSCLWSKTPKLDMQFPELDVCSSTCTQVCPFFISACRAVYKRCSSHLASSWLCPAVSTCLDKSVHQLSRVSCPSTQHLYNMHLYHKPFFCHRLKATNFFCLCRREVSEAETAGSA